MSAFTCCCGGRITRLEDSCFKSTMPQLQKKLVQQMGSWVVRCGTEQLLLHISRVQGQLAVSCPGEY